MAALHSLLALYGAFDQSVIEAEDPEWTALVERFLPGTTGLNERGWFAKLQELIDRLAPDPTAARLPSVADAVAELTSVADAISGVSQLLAETEPRAVTEDPGSNPVEDDVDGAGGDLPGEPPTLEPPLTTTDIAQALYIFTVGHRLKSEAPQTTVDFSAFTDDNLNAILGLAGESTSTIYRRGGAITSPRSDSDRREQIDGLREAIGNRFHHHRGWPAAMTDAFDSGYVAIEVATAPILLAGITTGAVTDSKGSSGTAAVTEIDGITCAVLTTDCWQQTTGLTVGAVKDIVDPRNWAALNAFFCEIDALGADANGASQVLEHISTDKNSYRMKTALKNWRRTFGDSAILNYDLADKRTGTGDSGLVLVDNGYIHISENIQDDGTVKGVRIRTSKMVAIEGSSVTVIAMLALNLGWAAASNAMLLDNAANPPTSLPDGRPLHKWSVNPEPSDKGPPTGAGQGPAQSPPAQLPPGSGGALVRDAVRLWARCVEDTAKTTSAIMNKWYDGQLTVDDMVRYSSDLGGRLASEPWRYLEDVRNRFPSQPPPQQATQNTDKGGSS